MMKKRPLATHHLAVSEIGLGTWAFGSDWGAIDEKASVAIMGRALENGITLFDTADIYGHGHSEKLLGSVLKGLNREDIVIVSKGGRDFYSSGCTAADLGIPRNFSKAYLVKALDQSLTRLGTEYIDIYLLHDPPREVLAEADLFAPLYSAKAAGLVRYIGVSIHNADEGSIVLSNHDIDVIEFPLSVFDPDGWAIADIARAYPVGLLARSPLARGTLTGKFTPTSTFAPDDHRSWRWSREEVVRRGSFSSTYSALIAKYAPHLTPAQVALRYILDDRRISAAIIGVRSLEQLDENCNSASSNPLPEQLREELHCLRAEFDSEWKGDQP